MRHTVLQFLLKSNHHDCIFMPTVTFEIMPVQVTASQCSHIEIIPLVSPDTTVTQSTSAPFSESVAHRRQNMCGPSKSFLHPLSWHFTLAQVALSLLAHIFSSPPTPTLLTQKTCLFHMSHFVSGLLKFVIQR